ncbi:pyruvate kinase [Thermoplasma volcanium GSS1]|uniref:Pyruvate kinase n=1 Tax=Thermoplasma volcanium (strain ATCC 51530 / DSM 4299 / JCM 9571 / NBRC 15438 / GSS1) TaxID=273116 RepID=Q979W1_THEVO|nr:pyruvate kinase [Thermoplasma volcanium]BAB60191.1 pyruvate kinase [Thermoplasma volcanium GSS1]
MKTKIVATVGPASEDPSILKQMVKNGLSLIRINSAHAEISYVAKIVKEMRDINPDVGVMVDLKGPELRTGTFPGGSLRISKGNKYTIGKEITLNNEKAIGNIQTGDKVLMSDGEVEFTVDSTSPIVLIAENDGVLRDRSRVNVPGRYVEIGSITERDKSFVIEGIKQGVDFFALSFVQNAENVNSLRDFIIENGGNQYIIAKIETKSGLDNIESIVQASDGIMVARGDLGVELPLKEVVMAQKKIIKISHEDGDFTIVATQVLESMVNNAFPTRAEISDITNAIIDNADALMLSEESAIGKYPALAVQTLRDVSDYVENLVDFQSSYTFKGNKIAYSVAKAAKVLSDDINSNGIVALTHTGSTVKMISSLRPKALVYAGTVDDSLSRKLNIYFGVVPLHLKRDSESLSFADLTEYILKSAFFKSGDKIVVTSGDPYFTFGGTNDVRVMAIGEFLGRGYPQGKDAFGTATYGKNGNILISNSKDVPDGNFDAYIFTADVKPSEVKKINGKTAVFKTRLARTINEGERIYIDGNTGIILKYEK